MYQISSKISDENISFILHNPWDLTKSEWHLQDSFGYDNAFSQVKHRLELCKKDGFYRIWKSINDEPIAVLGFFNVGLKKYETFFIASKLMNDLALKISYDLRTILKEETFNYKESTCSIYSASEHPKQMKWFAFLGFTYRAEGNIGNSRYFEYVSS